MAPRDFDDFARLAEVLEFGWSPTRVREVFRGISASACISAGGWQGTTTRRERGNRRGRRVARGSRHGPVHCGPEGGGRGCARAGRDALRATGAIDGYGEAVVVTPPSESAGVAFVRWLRDRVIADARGDGKDTLPFAPSGYLWLGRLAPQKRVLASPLGDRAERLDPCAVGFRVLPSALDGRVLHCRASARAWLKEPSADTASPSTWKKTPAIDVHVPVNLPAAPDATEHCGSSDLAAAFSAVGASGLSAEIQVEVEPGSQGPELVVTLVNTSPDELPGLDTTLYEVKLQAEVGDTRPFLLDDLPNSFRYDRRVAGYGVNGGVELIAAGRFGTTDYAVSEQARPEFWDASIGTQPDLSFAGLARDPSPILRALVDAMRRWGGMHWSTTSLEQRAKSESWTAEMLGEAQATAGLWLDELEPSPAGRRRARVESCCVSSLPADELRLCQLSVRQA